ncbi:MAG: gephyrin-like molybdotransferase Glp, partial [Planctomycetales bacterium]
AGRAIRRLAGINPDWPHRAETGTLKSKIVSQVGRVDYCRVRINDGQIGPVALSGASILSSTTRANGFVIVPSALEGYAAGTSVEVRLYS